MGQYNDLYPLLGGIRVLEIENLAKVGNRNSYASKGKVRMLNCGPDSPSKTALESNDLRELLEISTSMTWQPLWPLRWLQKSNFVIDGNTSGIVEKTISRTAFDGESFGASPRSPFRRLHLFDVRHAS